MVLIERIMASLATFIACDLFRLDSRDIARARGEPPARGTCGSEPRDDRQVIVRFGR